MKVKDAVNYLERIENAQRCLVGLDSIDLNYESKDAFDSEISQLLCILSDMIKEKELK